MATSGDRAVFKNVAFEPKGTRFFDLLVPNLIRIKVLAVPRKEHLYLGVWFEMTNSKLWWQGSRFFSENTEHVKLIFGTDQLEQRDTSAKNVTSVESRMSSETGLRAQAT
ncbi:hypothetical protein EVAR_61648_1 [Eumeta japonica]|uniref:Uncharacterized protein n=1 Tax=Eumeta variegata TaxID=151549 RepID=A0A4C1Z9A2_EUMVA|nr:hypothetical protein EVAR_61648_1 [Eumeta japonica]